MSGTVQANDGAMLPLDSLPQQFIYSGSFISEIIVQYQGNTYTQTFENDGTNIIYVSGWINIALPPSDVPMADESGVIMTDEDGQIMITE